MEWYDLSGNPVPCAMAPNTSHQDSAMAVSIYSCGPTISNTTSLSANFFSMSQSTDTLSDSLNDLTDVSEHSSMEIDPTLDGFVEACDFKVAEDVLASLTPVMDREIIDQEQEQFDKIVFEMVREANFLEFSAFKESLNQGMVLSTQSIRNTLIQDFSFETS